MKQILNKLYTSNIIIISVLVILLKPHFLTTNLVINNIENILITVLSSMFIIIYIKNNQFNKLILAILLYYVILMIATIVNRNGLIYFMFRAVRVFGLVTYVDLILDKDKENFLKSFLYLFSILNGVNFITILLNSNREINRNYLLGYDNDMAIILTIGCFILFVYQTTYQQKKRKKAVFIVNYIICVLSAFIVRSATFKVSILMFIICVVLYSIGNILVKLNKILNYKTYFLMTFILFVLIVFCNIQNYFSQALNLLKRDITFTGRTEIWENTIEVIKGNPVLGTGYMNMQDRNLKLGIYHAHSTYLNVLLETGIVGAGMYLCILTYIDCFFKKITNKKVASILAFGMFTYFIMTIFEVYIEIAYIYILLIIITNCSSMNKIRFKYLNKKG